MKKYFSLLPIFNFLILIVLWILFNIIGIAIIPLVLIAIFGGIAVIGLLTAKFENISNINNLKIIIYKIALNYIMIALIYNVMLSFILHFSNLSRIFVISNILAIESILPFGITLILKFKSNQKILYK